MRTYIVRCGREYRDSIGRRVSFVNALPPFRVTVNRIGGAHWEPIGCKPDPRECIQWWQEYPFTQEWEPRVKGRRTQELMRAKGAA